MPGMSYWKRARSWAWEHTETYSVKKAIPPLLAAVGQHWIFHLHPRNETSVIAATVLGGYVLLCALEFLWKLLVSAPVALYSEQGDKIAERERTIQALSEKPKRSTTDEHYYQEAQEIVSKLSTRAKQVMRHIWAHEKMLAAIPYKVPGLTSEEVRIVLEKELATEPASRIIPYAVERTPHRTPCWDITPIYRDALAELLHEK